MSVRCRRRAGVHIHTTRLSSQCPSSVRVPPFGAATSPAGRSPAPHLNECAAPIGVAHRLGSVLPAGPGPGRAVAHRDRETGNRDQLRPFLQGRRLPAAPVPVRCRAGLLPPAALGAGGRPPSRQGRDLPAPRARARVPVEGVNAPAKTCDIGHHPHLPPKRPDGPVPPARRPDKRPAPVQSGDQPPQIQSAGRPANPSGHGTIPPRWPGDRHRGAGRAGSVQRGNDPDFPPVPLSPTRPPAPSRPCSPTPPAKTPTDPNRTLGGPAGRAITRHPLIPLAVGERLCKPARPDHTPATDSSGKPLPGLPPAYDPVPGAALGAKRHSICTPLANLGPAGRCSGSGCSVRPARTLDGSAWGWEPQGLSPGQASA